MKRFVNKKIWGRLICLVLVLTVFGCAAISTNADTQPYEEITLDYGNIPASFNNELDILLTQYLLSNMYAVDSGKTYNSTVEIRFLSNGIFRLAAYHYQHLYINDYDSDFCLLESRDIPMELPLWGGIYLGEDASYVLSAHDRRAESESDEVYRITKFDSDFNQVATVSISAGDSYSIRPFGFGNVSMGLHNNILTIFTNRTYSGYNDYSAFAIQIDVTKMDGSDSHAAVTFPRTGFEGFGDPYRNILGIDGDKPVYAMVNASDYLAGVYICTGDKRWNLKPDTSLGDNEFKDQPLLTNATNMAVSSSHYLVASVFENYGINNIYLATMDKETGEVSGRFFTDGTAFHVEVNENPWIVDLGNDRFALLWDRIELGMVNVCSVVVDASGTPVSQVQVWRDCALSSSVPICVEDSILWVTAKDGEMKLYRLSDLDTGTYQAPDNSIVTGDVVWDGTADTAWYREDCTEFTLTTAEQLAGLAQLVNDGNDFSGKTVKLGNDLFMNSTPYGHIEGNEWIPIGTSDSEDEIPSFCGTFDGQCHTIYNMRVSYDGLNGGVFGTIGSSGTVKCLTVSQGWFSTSASVADTNYGKILFCFAMSHVDSYSGEERGGICKENYGLIYGCQNEGFIEHCPHSGGIAYRNNNGGTISQCANKGLSSTYLGCFTTTGTGGIVYMNNFRGWVYNCYNLAALTNGDGRSAGIAGFSNGHVYNCYSLSGYPMTQPISYLGNSGIVENSFGNTEPGVEWYQEFCEDAFLEELDHQLGPLVSAWRADTLGVNNGLPIPLAEYNYHMGIYKVQPELWGVPDEYTVVLSEQDIINLSGFAIYFSDASLEITSDDHNIAEVIDGEIHLRRPGTVNILFHLDETKDSTALDYAMKVTVLPGENWADYGDVNGDGDVNVLDMILLRQHIAGWDVTINPAGGDANGDGDVNVLDMILLRQYIAGWDVTLGPQ